MLMQPEETPPNNSWSYRPEEDESLELGLDSASQQPSFEPITWSGSEFITRQKDIGWYLVLFIALGIIGGLIYLFSKDLLSVIFIVIMGALFAIVAARKPRQLQFMIDDTGLHVGNRVYYFTDFKSFSVQHDGAIGHMDFLPLRRFQGELSVYYAPEDEKRIFDALAARIPHEQRRETILDRLVKLIHF